MHTLSVCLAACLVTGLVVARVAGDGPGGKPADKALRLGNFSVSLAVKDLQASRAFYEKLGFRKSGGDEKRYVILQNDTATIGLFQGMFEGNLLTFNPGWDRACNTLEEFDDVREIQRRLRAEGIAIVTGTDEAGTGPAHIVVTDPDGNQVLLDQHVPSPGR